MLTPVDPAGYASRGVRRNPGPTAPRASRFAARARRALTVVSCAAMLACGPPSQGGIPETPAELYQELYAQAQLSRVYTDGKTLADARALAPPRTILAAYRRSAHRPDFQLAAFLARHFAPRSAPKGYHPTPGDSAETHIDRLWDALARPPDSPLPSSSRIALPYGYVVPGGRFDELYYWDTYFTMLGLVESGRMREVEAIIANFAWLIDRFGHVPNGSRTYYLSRSQPPFFALMLGLLDRSEGPSPYAQYLPQLQREHAWWMDGDEALSPGQAHRRVVRMPDGAALNRYWDDRDTPRDEAFAEDMETARASGRPRHEVYRHLRAAAESGWDFSSRWLKDPRALSTIHTTDLIPPDLNSLLYVLEQAITRGCRERGDASCAQSMQARADARKHAMAQHLWSDAVGAFVDYDFLAKRTTGRLSAATLYPLFAGACSPARARAVAATTRTRLLRQHGLATTEIVSGQQWDAPNGWAPLQWIAVRGLLDYGEADTAREVATRWIAANLALFEREGRFVEKYDVESARAGAGGEYPAQDGFGWTNGVLRKLLTMYPVAATQR